MELPVLEITEDQAQAAYEEYRDAVREAPKAKLDDAQREYEEMDRAVMRGYKEVAKGNSLLRLSEAFAAGGLKELEATWTVWNGETSEREEVAGTILVPALAMTRADAKSCFCIPILDGSDYELHANAWDTWHAKKADRVIVRAGTFSGTDEYGSRRLDVPPSRVQFDVRLRAITPTIPPTLRPPHKLSGYHILWEADWAVIQEPQVPPGDPALLKHLGGELYAVLAVWDLTDLERAVLGGMRAD